MPNKIYLFHNRAGKTDKFDMVFEESGAVYSQKDCKEV